MIRRKPSAKPKPPPAVVQWHERPEGFWLTVSDTIEESSGILGEFSIHVAAVGGHHAAQLRAFDDAVAIAAVKTVINEAMDILADTGTFKTGEASMRKILRDAFNARGWSEVKR